MKKHKGLIIAGVVLAALAAFCLWYTLVPKSWANISDAGQINSLSGSIYYGDESGKLHEHSSLRLEADGGHPAAQAIVSSLERHTYRADLANLSPIPRDTISVPGATALQFYLRTQKRFTQIIIYSNGQLLTGGLSMSPEGCRSYKTDTDLFQEVLQTFQKYGISDQEQSVIKP